jgi:hypothetical protein
MRSVHIAAPIRSKCKRPRTAAGAVHDPAYADAMDMSTDVALAGAGAVRNVDRCPPRNGEKPFQGNVHNNPEMGP